MKVKVAQCPALCNPMDYSPSNSPGQNTGVSGLSLLQVIFPTQGSEPRSPTLQADSLPAESQGSPSPADLPDTGIKLGSLTLRADFLPTELSGKP